MELKIIFTILIIVICCACSSNSEEVEQEKSIANMDYKTVGRQLIEQGRTLVHHAVKRFMIILPAIFFKLGIAFTLLILIALAAVNNGFIGFLLLVVGMSSVLARLQESRRTAVPVPYINPLPPYHHHVWDRSDTDGSDRNQDTKTFYNGYSGQNIEYTPQISNYYGKYGQYGSTKV